MSAAPDDEDRAIQDRIDATTAVAVLRTIAGMDSDKLAAVLAVLLRAEDERTGGEPVPEQMLTMLRHVLRWHDQLNDGDIAKLKQVIALAEASGLGRDR